MPETNIVQQFYDDDPAKEWSRLERHRMEFAVTMRALQVWLPPAPATILDIGGGPGRYAIALAKRGYDVTLLDLSQANLDFAQRKAAEAGVVLRGFVHGNALDLSAFANKSFDAALLMGPLYHLFTSEDRRHAVHEAMRVLRPAGMAFAACITRFAAIREAASRNPHWYVEEQDMVDRYLDTGVLPVPMELGFVDHYSMHPTGFAPLMEDAGFHTLELIGVEGVLVQHEALVNQLDDDAFSAWVDLSYKLGHDPALHAASDHLLYIGRKQGRFASAIVRRGNEILLQQGQGPQDAGPSWYIPGGTIEPHENFEQGIIREVREETGIQVLSVASLAYSTHMRHVPSQRGGMANVYEITDWRGEISVDDPDKIVLQARFVSVTEAIELIEQTLPFANMRDPLLAYLRGDPKRVWHYQAEEQGEMRLVSP